jgi:hypothetical protein
VVRILVDADACPVKDEIYRVARRLETPVTVVANSWMRIPHDPGVDLVVVGNELDAADDWIAEHAGNRDIVVTADIPLAARCLEKGARVVGPKGRPFTTDSIGEALASRELLSQLREMGIASEGPPPFQKRDRSSFLHKLDEMIRAIRREAESS